MRAVDPAPHGDYDPWRARRCPQCGKTFRMGLVYGWGWKLRKKGSGSDILNFCSYHCMRIYERKQNKK